MMRGFTFFTSSKESPARASAGARRLLTKTSASRSILSTTSRPCGVVTSMATLRLLRFSSSSAGLTSGSMSASPSETSARMGSPPSGFSILTTSAPQSPSTAAAAGPATNTPISTTLIPESGPIAYASAVPIPRRRGDVSGDVVALVALFQSRVPETSISPSPFGSAAHVRNVQTKDASEAARASAEPVNPQKCHPVASCGTNAPSAAGYPFRALEAGDLRDSRNEIVQVDRGFAILSTIPRQLSQHGSDELAPPENTLVRFKYLSAAS